MNSLNQNQPRAEVRAMTPMESFATFNPVGVRLKGLGNIGNNIVGGLAGSLKENLAIVSDIKAFAIGSQTSVVTGRFDPESGILRSFQNGTLAQDSARLFGQAVTGTVKGPFDLMDGMRYGNADKIGTGGAAVLGMAGPAFGRLGRVEVATTTEFVGPGIGKSGYQSSAEFADAVGAKYQSFVDDAYRSGQNLEVKGLLRGLSSTRLGDYIDRSSARDLKSFLRSEGISEGPGSLIRMNRFMRNPESPNLYVRPDVYIPSANRIFDATVGFKSYNDVQIQRFNQFSGGSYITNVRPSMSPLGGSYSFNPNLLIKGN